MRDSAQLLVALGLAGIVLGIGALETTLPETDPEMLHRARAQSEQPVVSADEPAPAAGGLGEVVTAALSDMARLFADTSTLAERLAGEQYGDWRLAPGLDSVFSDSLVRTRLEGLVGSALKAIQGGR